MTQPWIEKLLELKQSGRRIRITVDNDSMRADDITDTDEPALDRGMRVVGLPHPADALDDLLAHLGFVVEGA